MENRKENKRQLLRKRQKTNQINTIFVAAVNAEDNVTLLLSDPDDGNSNLICVAEYALELENILSESVEQNEPCKSTGATNPKNIVDTSHYFRILFMILSLVTWINGPTCIYGKSS